MVQKSYSWEKVRRVLLNLNFTEILPSDEDIRFYQYPEKGLVTLHPYIEGVDTQQIKVMCDSIKFRFEDFVNLMD